MKGELEQMKAVIEGPKDDQYMEYRRAMEDESESEFDNCFEDECEEEAEVDEAE